jgi:carbamoyltransferase
MNILAIHFGFNSSIAYTENGKLLYLLHEEKFDNIKNSICFPKECIEYLKTKVDISKVDRITIWPRGISKESWNRYLDKKAANAPLDVDASKIPFMEKVFYGLYKYVPKLFDIYNDYLLENEWRYKAYFAWLSVELTKHLGKEITPDMIDLVDHHLSHALSPVYFYGLHKSKEPILLMTLDGAWDRDCSSVRVWENGNYRDLGHTRFQYSLGFLWSYITLALGMKAHEHEYKVMWLAAYTEEKYFKKVYDKLFAGLIWVDGFEFKSRIPLNRANVFLRDKLYGLRFDNIAWALQYLTENLITEWIRTAVEKTGIKKIAMAGGVFMNVKMNKRIQEVETLDKAYFMPSAGDESTVLGLILYSYVKHGYNLDELEPINSMYGWIDITKSDVEAFLPGNISGKYEVENLENLENSSKRVAELLADHKIVGVCHGKWEWGARSLCNRAILSNASDLKNFHTVNDMIKMRDFWMPFAPTILEEYAPKYLKNWESLKSRTYESSHYMITAFDSTPVAQLHLRAAIHQKDKTLRPQLVTWESNPWMYATLNKFEELTGMGGVMNTSLNIHGYPLVGTLEQALFTFENSGLEYILLEHFLIKKKA